MCRIGGILHKNITGPEPSLTSILRHQVHGGPDTSAIWNDDYCGLAHNRLAIIDLSDHGAQPMESGHWVVCYNGEIYNHLELRTRISRQWNGTSDTETLLYLIEMFGVERTVNYLEGMYSFAAYNKQSRILFLVTDPLSIKPLYYHYDSMRTVFASTIAAIALQLDELKLDRQSLIDYLALGSTREPLFEGIRKVPPASILRIQYNESFHQSLSTYWHPSSVNALHSEDIIRTLTRSIESVKMSDVPLFLFLSGGVDSSLVAGCLPGVRAVHLASPEEPYAIEAANLFGSSLDVIDPTQEDAEECLMDYAFKSGDCSMAALIPYITAKHSVKFGKVAISANGADELFFGYPRTMESVSKMQVDHIFRRLFFNQSSWHLPFGDGRHLELMSYVAYDLNKTLDYASMCHGLEVRVPFLNKSVIEAALSLDRAQHVNGYGYKSILKKWLISRGFSRQFVTREKMGFSLHRDPVGYQQLQAKGVELLATEFQITPSFPRKSRDERYYQMSAAAFYCWFEVWNGRLS